MNNKSKSKPLGDTRTADTNRLQEMMHYHGLEAFQELLKQAYYNASDDTERIDMNTAELYRDAANRLEDITK